MSDKIQKILIFIEGPFNARDYIRFGVDTFLKNGFDVHVINFTPILHPKVHETIEVYDKIEFINHRYVTSMAEINNELKYSIKNTFIISFLPFRTNVYRLYRLISKYKLPYAVLGGQPVVGEKRLDVETLSNFKKIIRKIRKINLSNLPTYMLAYLPIWLLGLKPARYVFCITNLSFTGIKIIGESTDSVMVHAYDYDNYLDSLKKQIVSTKTIVFLDQNIPFHLDHIIQSTKNVPKPEEYYPDLCSAFDRIENAFKVKVIIACHPRANKVLLQSYYKGRHVVLGVTNDVVRECELCISHYSRSISYAVLYKKPIIFITTNSIEKSSLAHRIISYASYFNKEVINISKNFSIDKKRELYIDDNIYEQYTSDFIKSKNSSSGKFWDIVSEKIKTI
jgi:hypothetical protein